MAVPRSRSRRKHLGRLNPADGLLRNLGIDYLRVFAIALITAQHAASLTGAYAWTFVGDLSWGQLGVSMFIAISGYYSATDHDTAFRWLIKRFRRLFPAYWLVTILAFTLARMEGHPFTAFQVISQMAGTGFFTHGWALVNVVSWYISLLLLCYAIAAVSRLCRHPVWVMATAGVIAVVLVASHTEVSLSRHVVTYCAAAVVGRSGDRWLLPIAAALAMSALLSASLIYAVIGLMAVGVGLRIGAATRWTGLVADHIYEYFLIHGIVLAGAVQAIHHPVTAIVTAILAAAIGSILLKRITKICVTAVSKFWMSMG